VDDYKDWEGCRLATNEFREQRGITAEIKEIEGYGVYWQVPLA
jgi:hypothetical protein